MNLEGTSVKIIHEEKIGGHIVVRFIANATVDGQATIRAAETAKGRKLTDEETEQLFNDPSRLVYCGVGEEGERVEDAAAEPVQAKLDAMGEHQRVEKIGDGEYEYIDDYRDVEYWIKESNTWQKVKVEEIGLTPPEGAVLLENVTMEMQAEIHEQQEEERLAALTPEQRAKERIAVLKRELADTDYIAVKIAEGSATVQDYAEMIAQRQAWRQEINTLEEAA